jgi:hypothetical protein
MKKPLLYGISMLGVLSMAIAEEASARIICGAAGESRIGGQANCFTSSFNTCGVTSSCNADLLVPLTVDASGVKSVTYTRGATAAGAICRLVSNNLLGTAVSVSGFDPIPANGGACVPFTFPAISVAGVLFLDCITNPGTNLCAVAHTPP